VTYLFWAWVGVMLGGTLAVAIVALLNS